MAPPNMDVSRWPVVVVTFAPEADLQDLAIFLEQLEQVYLRGRMTPFVSVLDLRQQSFLGNPAPVRTKFAEGLNRLLRDYPQSKAGEVAVIDSAPVRALYTGINWFRQRPFATHTCADVEAGVAWAQQLLLDRRA